jgi:hypothetical protein
MSPGRNGRNAAWVDQWRHFVTMTVRYLSYPQLRFNCGGAEGPQDMHRPQAAGWPKVNVSNDTDSMDPVQLVP